MKLIVVALSNGQKAAAGLGLGAPTPVGADKAVTKSAIEPGK